MLPRRRAADFGGAFGVAVLSVLAGCSVGDAIPDDPSGNLGRGTGSPARRHACTRLDHERYTVIAPDGKQYPTWHPPIDSVTDCSFGHEHGRDPRGSNLHAVIGDVPFGVAEEALETWDPSHSHREEHAGHKIEWENGIMLQQSVGGKRSDIGVRCDLLVKIHQGAPRKTTLNHNLHELAYHVKCDDGTEIHATKMVSFQGHDENRVSTNDLTTVDGAVLAYFDPHFLVYSPGPSPDSGVRALIGSRTAACQQVKTNGDQAHGGGCNESAILNMVSGLSYADPQSGFHEVHRQVYFNQTGIYNAAGPTLWYTDPFGGNARPVPFRGSIRQYVAAVNNDRGFALESQALGSPSPPVPLRKRRG